MKIIQGKQQKPRKLLIYGPHGVGKSTLASGAPRPVFLDVEDGLNDLDVAKTERLTTALDVHGSLVWLGGNEHPYQSVVIDSLDWLERLIWARVAQREEKESIEEIPYGRGYKFALKIWDTMLQSLGSLMTSKQMHVVLLAHAKVAKFSPPDADSYDRYEPALHDLANRLIQEWCDEVLFLNTRIMTRSTDEGFGQKRKIAIGGKDRVIKTSESASVIAKSRCDLPEEMDCETFWQTYLGSKQNIKGVVTEGSSKPKKETVNG